MDTSRRLQVSRTGQDGEILVMTMDRPRQRNAVDQQLADEIDAAMTELETAPGLRVGILTGGPDFFCAGTDLSLTTSPVSAAGGEYGVIRRARTRPLIAAVEGFALGGGMEIALACDLVVAAESASFGLPEAQRGVVAVCGALFRGPEKLSPNTALELLLTNTRIDADRAHALGMVNRVAPSGQALEWAVQFAEEIVLSSPQAVAGTLHAVNAERARREAAAWAHTELANLHAAASTDRAEGVTAFFEKRQPRW
ncbi:enoyl-CoA hydratase-related protein [Nocardioides sp. AE5]|uniref:enoyl-CoA hydratase-related protein n=1 Tax=Nocardioides sp. AE5 TaxID=2962573 RepID=UPI0028825581|nr:enoyl-CoA hydratase-related protein [Nocardioides sp. AE5]MDT0202717.1 enoyl-CoA hydratase-related protein [Nocardioides sp. AE5]